MRWICLLSDPATLVTLVALALLGVVGLAGGFPESGASIAGVAETRGEHGALGTGDSKSRGSGSRLLHREGSSMPDDDPDQKPDPSPDAPPLPPGYEYRGELGRGAFGVVYRVLQVSANRVVALKVLDPGAAGFEGVVARFRREAESLARLRHPHLVAVHDVGTFGGALYYTMDLVEGGSLADEIRRGPLSARRAVAVVRQVAEAVAHIHAHGVLHRDLKPANVLLDEQGSAFVADFGLARDREDREQLTRTGSVLGTPRYMAPEQALGDPAAVDERADVYALGAILYECLTGEPVFGDQPILELIRSVLEREPVAPRRRNPRIPRDLEVVCLKALEKEPARRYPTAAALVEDLVRFGRGRPILARPASPSYVVGRFVSRHRSILLPVGLAAVLVAVTLGVGRSEHSTDTLFEETAALVAAGHPGAAAVLYEREVRRRGLRWPLPAEKTGSEEYRLLTGLADCRLAAARELLRAGRAEEALKLVRETDSAMPSNPVLRGEPAVWPGRDGLPLLYARCLRATGNPGGAWNVLVEDHGGRRWRVAPDLAAREDLDRIATSLVEVFGADFDDPFAPDAAEAVRLLGLFVDLVPSKSPGRPGLAGDALAAALLRRPATARNAVTAGLARIDGLGKAPAFLRETAWRLAGTPERALLLDSLAAIYGDLARSRPARMAALGMFGTIVDLPVLPATAPEAEDEELAAGIAAWRALRGLDRVAGWRRRMEIVRARAEATGAAPLLDWLREHAAGETDDPVVGLAASLGWPGRPSAQDLPAVLRRLVEAAGPERARWHDLAALLSPPDLPVPQRTDESGERTAYPMEWVRAIRADPRFPDPWPEDRTVRVSVFEVSPGDSRPRVVAERVATVGVGRPGEIQLPPPPPAPGLPLPPALRRSDRLTLPGFVEPPLDRFPLPFSAGHRADDVRKIRLEVRPVLAGGGFQGLHLVVDSPTPSADPFLTRRFTGAGAPVGLVAVPLLDVEEGWASEGTTTLVLATEVHSDEAATPIGPEDWERMLAEGLRRLADAGLGPDDPLVLQHRAGAFVLPLPPPAADALKRIARNGAGTRTIVRIHGFHRSATRDTVRLSDPTVVPFAAERLFAGDASVLDEGPERLWSVDGVSLHPVLPWMLDNLDPAPFFARLAAAAKEESIRRFALSRLGGHPASPGSRSRVAGAPAGAGGGSALSVFPTTVLACGAFWLVTILLAVLSLRRGPGKGSRLVPAVLLGALGVLAVALDVRIDGVDLLHDAAGLLAAALAGWVLGRASRDLGGASTTPAARWLAVGGFAFAFASEAAARLGLPAGPAAMGAALGTLSGVAGFAALGAGGLGSRRSTMYVAFLLMYPVPALAAWGRLLLRPGAEVDSRGGLYALLGPRAGQLGGTIAALGLGLGLLLPFLAALDRLSERRGGPRRGRRARASRRLARFAAGGRDAGGGAER